MKHVNRITRTRRFAQTCVMYAVDSKRDQATVFFHVRCPRATGTSWIATARTWITKATNAVINT